ncbi:MAG: hypothetical protein ACI4NM_03235, partial [Bullifex sp.]
MRKHFIMIIAMLLLISCNASILMTNGEVVKPGSGIGNVIADAGKEFSGDAPSSINATKSYYTSSIVVRWSAVEGA